MTSTSENIAPGTADSKKNTTANRWIPLEGNPEVFNSWADQAGVIISQNQFVDIYGLDEDLLSIIPKPTKAVILLFPSNSPIKAKQAEHDEKIAAKGQHPIDETLMYVKQYVGNACGTIALIHAIANSEVTYKPESPLQRFISICKDKTPQERGKLLESTDLFTKVHLDSSALGQTSQPSNEEDGMNTDLHFTCFVAAPDGNVRKEAMGRQHTLPVGEPGAVQGSSAAVEPSTTTSPPQGLPGDTVQTGLPLSHKHLFATEATPADDQLEGMRLIELDGRRPFPIDHGPCTDVLDDVINVVKKQYLSQVESVYFSLMAFGPAPVNSPFN
ncbi:hypothetical protein D9756_009126 [Leucocoprinus leucothites]|uniref:Ubiquitin carboxyl-terminal hydrolase n=1 Tax=Leucocoprinus leucothites TaxID=201217 RepID=A0A8H5FUF0_9AGAR|nr:hypothetical protein D9756_009126 [Leucoagaricus leucothites]